MYMASKKYQWLLPMMLILFILQVLLFPFAMGVTYSGRSESPNHILTYTTGQLTWDSSTGINEYGVAELSLFNDAYENVISNNGDNIIAPGTDGYNIIRLRNRIDYSIDYVAVMYQIKSNEQLPIEVKFSSEGSKDTKVYPLPKGVDKSQVISAVTGTVDKNEIQDFDIQWLWEYYIDDEQDIYDTEFGNKAAFDKADDITIGIYIVIEEGDHEDGGSTEIIPVNPVDPEEPETIPDPDIPLTGEIPTEIEETEIIVEPEIPLVENIPENNTNEYIKENNINVFVSDKNINDDKNYIYPEIPKTRDNSNISVYITLMIISGIILLLLIVENWRDRKCSK